MVKQGHLVSLLLALAFALSACTSATPVIADHPMNFSSSKDPASIERVWSLKIEGQITDLNLSANGSAVLVATQPDHDSDKSGGYALILVNAGKGKIRWRREMKGLVKAQTISGDGDLVVISDYDEEIEAYDRDGKRLWTSDGVCKPQILDSVHKILCFHDDDGEPGVAFDVFDFEGKKLSSYPITRDVLLLKTSADQRQFATAFAGGFITLFSTEKFKPVWKRKVDGEISDIAVSSGGSPEVAVLYKPAKAGTAAQRIAVFGPRGKQLARAAVPSFAEQLESAPGGNGVFTYGNGPRGQALSFFARNEKGLKEGWSRRDRRFADYSSQLIVSRRLVLVGFENEQQDTRLSHLLFFDFDGGLKADIQLQTEEGAYIYAQGYSPAASFLAVGTDDGTLSGYRVIDRGSAMGSSMSSATGGPTGNT